MRGLSFLSMFTVSLFHFKCRGLIGRLVRGLVIRFNSTDMLTSFVGGVLGLIRLVIFDATFPLMLLGLLNRFDLFFIMTVYGRLGAFLQRGSL